MLIFHRRFADDTNKKTHRNAFTAIVNNTAHTKTALYYDWVQSTT